VWADGSEDGAPKVVLTKPPTLEIEVPPVYPFSALSRQIRGAVMVQATADQNGNVVDAKAVQGSEILKQAALDAVREWRYKTGAVNGKPTQMPSTVTVRFGLQ
jgi:periplasmic protein TonB